MELKLLISLKTSALKTSSNRTFMELKLLISLKTSALKTSSNRTFMELKSCWCVDGTVDG